MPWEAFGGGYPPGVAAGRVHEASEFACGIAQSLSFETFGDWRQDARIVTSGYRRRESWRAEWGEAWESYFAVAKMQRFRDSHVWDLITVSYITPQPGCRTLIYTGSNTPVVGHR
jgi:hypothetical protein